MTMKSLAWTSTEVLLDWCLELLMVQGILHARLRVCVCVDKINIACVIVTVLCVCVCVGFVAIWTVPDGYKEFEYQG